MTNKIPDFISKELYEALKQPERNHRSFNITISEGALADSKFEAAVRRVRKIMST